MDSPQCRGTWISPRRVTWYSVPHSPQTKNTSSSATSSGSIFSFGVMLATPRRKEKPANRMARKMAAAITHVSQDARPSTHQAYEVDPVLAEALDDGGVGHATALAHRLEAVAGAAALQLVQHRGHELGPGRSQRVADRDGATVRVDVVVEPLFVDAELSLPRQHDRGEGFVDLHHVDVRQSEAGPIKHTARRMDGRGAHEDRRIAGQRERQEPGPRRQAELLRPLRRGDQHGRGPVRDL